MKNYNTLIIFCVLLYLILAVILGLCMTKEQRQAGNLYKVEMNRILSEISEPADVGTVDLGQYQTITDVAYLSADATDRNAIMAFYQGNGTAESVIRPLDNMEGYLRFDYQKQTPKRQLLLLAEGVLFVSGVFLLSVLFYLKRHLIRPFHEMQEMVRELSKGNFYGEVKADRNRYFGSFLWGISALRDALYTSRKKELALQKEKKMLLLSLSHDIKTPLNMIKLYGKALEEGIYATEEEKVQACRKIGEKTQQIEAHVNEIIKASREDILHITVKKEDFYLKDLIRKVQSVYGEKCALRKCELITGAFENRLLCGDVARLLEVFENLFENAFKYGDGRRIELTFYEEDYCQLIQVFNTGMPVAENDFAYLFDSFFRGENAGGRQGNGLGLYICKEIMHKTGGEIFATQKTDGMAFTIVLPIEER